MADIETKNQEIKKFLKTHNIYYEPSNNNDHIDAIYELFINNIIPVIIDDLSTIICLGLYYSIKKDYENMKKYYLIGIDKGDLSAINALGKYYEELKDYDNMKKYYLMAVEKNDSLVRGKKNSVAMIGLGKYYEELKDYDNMKKYYLMAIERGNTTAMYHLCKHYEVQKDYDNMKKYYLMAIERNNVVSMYSLGLHYHKQKEYDNMKKYYLMAIERGYSPAMYILAQYYGAEKDHDNTLKYYLMAIRNSQGDPVMTYESGNNKASFALMNYCNGIKKAEGLILFQQLHKEGIPKAEMYLSVLMIGSNREALDEYVNYVKNIDIKADKQEIEIANLKAYITELEFAPGGPKYVEAKEHFELMSLINIEL
jgi:tetratricopeptide (TPR) repeat protein